MRSDIDGVEFEYEYEAGRDGHTVLFLHGWGGDLRSFAGAYRAIADRGMTAVNLAFPKAVPPDWGIYDYAAFVSRFTEREGIARPIIVGHSFGGRVAIILASQKRCDKLVLVDSAGMKPRFSLKRAIRIARYHRRVKTGKPLDGYGSKDYNNTSGDGRRVFVRIVNAHLDRLLPYISCPTLIVWGRKDADTPPYMARRLHRGIAGSKLVFVDGGHYGYIDSHYRFLGELTSFITG